MTWLPPTLLPTRARMRLFCLPYAGGGASAYRPWANGLQADVQLCPVQLPGRENRLGERLFTSVGDLVPPLVDALRPFLDRPFAIFGHSMGGLLAFEAARRMRRLGLPAPRQLFVSSHRAPHLRDRATQMHLLGPAEFREALRNLHGTPEEVLSNEELMQIAEPILRADFQLCETYAYTPDAPLDMPISVFGGTDDADVPEEDLRPWEQHTNAGAALQMFPGHHLYLRNCRDALVATINSTLGGVARCA